MPTGNSVLKIVATGSNWNIDWIEISEETDTDTDTDTCNNIQAWDANTVYSEAGIQVVYNNNIYKNNIVDMEKCRSGHSLTL